MKIKKIHDIKYKLLRFNLIKSKIIKKNHIKSKISIDNIEIRLKKALQLIYLYHTNNKKILFVGNPLNINQEIAKLLKNTKHIFIPKSAWVSGIITNQNSSLKSIFKKENNLNHKLSQRILQLKKKSDLVVIINKNIEKSALEESYSTRIPIITLNSDLNPFDNKSNYKIPGNFILSKNKLKNNFFYLILLSTLKKSQRIKTKFPGLSHSLSTVIKLKKNKKRYH